MKGHVGDGARSGELKAPETGYRQADATSFACSKQALDDACSFVSITFDSAGIGSLKLMPLRSAIERSRLVGV
jgi:hypothetical protein